MMWLRFRGLDQVRSFAEAKKARDRGGTIEKPEENGENIDVF